MSEDVTLAVGKFMQALEAWEDVVANTDADYQGFREFRNLRGAAKKLAKLVYAKAKLPWKQR